MLLSKIIKQIGMTNKHAVVFEMLLTKPSSTPLIMARETKLNRSSLYRYLEELRAKGLVELVLGDKTSKYRANPEGLNQYLLSEESRVESLKQDIPALVSKLSKIEVPGGSGVKYFQGREGLKQMLWNVVSAGTEFVGLGYSDWNESVGRSFAEKLRSRIIKGKINSREILNHPSKNYAYTSYAREYVEFYKHRAIDQATLEIKHDTYIYRDVFAYYYHYQGEYFGVEIHNKEIAKTEKQMFEILWKMAK